METGLGQEGGREGLGPVTVTSRLEELGEGKAGQGALSHTHSPTYTQTYTTESKENLFLSQH